MLFTKEIYRLNVVLDFIPVFREAINIKKLGIFDYFVTNPALTVGY